MIIERTWFMLILDNSEHKKFYHPKLCYQKKNNNFLSFLFLLYTHLNNTRKNILHYFVSSSFSIMEILSNYEDSLKKWLLDGCIVSIPYVYTWHSLMHCIFINRGHTFLIFNHRNRSSLSFIIYFLVMINVREYILFHL